MHVLAQVAAQGLLIVAVSLTLTACGVSTEAGGEAQRDRDQKSDTTSTVEATIERTVEPYIERTIEPPKKQAGLFFPQSPEPEYDIMAARTVGKLFVEDGCIRLGPPPRSDVVVWPYGYSLRKEGGRIEIVDEEGNVEARVGDEVLMGGGQITQGESGATAQEERETFEEKRRELGVPDQCRGLLWAAASGVKVVDPEGTNAG